MAFSASYDNPAAPGTGAGVSNREDLTSLLTQLDPVSAPFTSLAPKRKAQATNHEWTLDGLAAVDFTGLHEGADVSSFNDKFENRIRLGNIVQGFRRDFQVSQVQQAISSVGPAGDNAARVKCMREIKRDIEAAMWSENDKVTGSGSAKALMRGMFDWCSDTPPAGLPTAYQIHTDQTISATVTEDLFNGALASMYNVSGSLQNVTCIADTNVRRSIADFMRTGGSDETVRYNVNGSGKAVYLAVDLFHSDFGKIALLNSNPDTSPDTTFHDRGLLLNLEYVGLASLIPLKQVDLQDQGGGTRGYCESWCTLECLDVRAHGTIDEQRTS